MKAAKATLEGLSGIFRQLTQEHGEMAALLIRVKMTTDPEVRRELFPDIRKQLLAHERGEVREIYSAFRQHPDLEGMARDHEVDARQIEQSLEDLSSVDYADGRWDAKFAELVTLVERHVKEEEGEHFPAANRILGRNEAERLRERYLAAKSHWLEQSVS
ncbi:MAG: hemerythrin domain-containing protein [Polyangiaceae bacterium]|nr:hemerythrin domain-containing protein [Polyangiaceae bacterium]